MDAELRQKKLASGKEKLAAFRNKKAKAHKKSNVKNDTGDQEAALADFSSSTKSSEETSPSEALSLSDSELCSLPSDDEQSDEEGRPHIPFTVTELENAKDGQHLLSEMIQYGDSSQWTDPSHVESALSQRDELLSQLASSLKLIQELPTQTDDFTTQLYALAQHICLLKTKLNQANQDLQEQLLLHESSMMSLQAAKAQILQLQMIIIKKDEQISSMSQAVQLNSDSGFETLRLKDETLHHCQSMRQAQSEQLQIFKNELEAKVAECQRWAAAKEEWISKEQNLMVSISSKSEECTELQESFHLLKLEEHKLIQKCALLQATLADKDSDDRLQKLEQELVELRSTHESDSQEIARLQKRNQELEFVMDDHSKRLSYYQCLQQDYEHIMNQHSGCLSQLDSLNILNADLQQRIHALGQTNQDLQVLKLQFEDLRLNYQSEVQKRSELELKLSGATNSSEQRTLMSSYHSGPSVLSSYFTDFSTNNSFNYSEKEVNLATVSTPHIHHNVLSSSSDEQVSAPEKKRDGNVCNTQPDSDRLHLVATIDDLNLKLKTSETECLALAEKLKLLENEIASAYTAHDVEEKYLNSKEVELLQAEITTLTLQVQTQEAKLSQTMSELATTQNSLHSVQFELAQVRQDESKEKRVPEHPVPAADDTYYLQLVQQQLSEKETAQEELQSQLESTITQWQKLQLIVQEKEIEIQNLQENLDEQKRICSTMSTSHQEYIEILQSESDTLKLRLEEYQEKFFTMENEILQLITEKNSHQKELERVTASSQKESSEFDMLNKHDGLQTVVVDACIQTDCVSIEIQTGTITSDFNQQTECVDINIDSYTENGIQKSPDHLTQHVTIEVYKELIAEKDSVIISLQAAVSEKGMQIQELEAKVLNIESELFNSKVSHEDMVRSIQLSEEKLAQKDAESVSTSKKATAQQLKLKASKKQVAQKEEIITDLNRKLAESQEQISDLSRQKEEIITDLNRKLAESQEQISDLSRQKEEIITDLNRKLAESQEKNSDLRREKEEIITDLNRKLAESQEKNSDLRREKEEILTEVNKKLADSQEQISDLSRQLAERNSELSELRGKVSQIEEAQTGVEVENQGALHLLHDSIRIKEDQISNLTEQLLWKNAEIASFNAGLNEKEEYVTSLKNLHVEKEETCYAQGEQLSIIKIELLEKEEEIKMINTKVAEEMDVITNLNNVSSDNERQITDLKNNLLKKQNEIETMQEKVCEVEELMKSLQGQLTVRVEEIERLQTQIRGMEKDISDLSGKLSDKESQIVELQNVASEERSRFQKTITERDEQISLCNLKLQESSEEIVQLNGSISGKDQENSQVLQQLQAGQFYIVNLNEQLKEKEKEISKAAKWHAEKEEEMLNLQTELSEKTRELDEMKLNLSNQNEEMTQLLEIAHQRDEQLGTLQMALTEKSDYISMLSTKSSDTDESILALKGDLIEKEKENSSLLEQIAEKEEALVKLFHTVNERTDEIKDLSDKLSKQCSSSQTKAGEVTYLNGQLLEKDEALGNLLMTLSVKDDLIVELNSKLSHLTEDIVGLQNALSEKDASIATLTHSLSMKGEDCMLLKDKVAQFSEIKDKLLETEKKLTYCESEKKDLAATLNQKADEITELYKNILEKDKQLLELTIILEQKAETDKQSSNKDVEMTSLHKHLMEKDEEISHLQGMLVEKDEQIKSSTQLLYKKDSAILRLQSELTVQLSDYNRKLFDKDEEIGNLLITLSGKDETVLTLGSKVETCNEEILSLHKLITGKDESCADLNQGLSDQLEEITKLNESLTASVSRESELNRELAEKDEEISILQLTVSEKDGQILDLDAKFADLENGKLMLQKEVEDRMSEVSQTKKDFSDEIALLKNVITEKDDQVLNFQKSLDERENEMIQLNMTLADRNKEVTSLSDTISELNNALVKLQKSADEKNALIMQIQNTLTDQTAEIDSLQTFINDKKDEIKDLHRTIENTKEENVRLQMTINEKTELFAALQTQIKMEATNETELLLSAKDDEISRKEAQISEFWEHIANMKKQLEDDSFTLSQKEKQIIGMSQTLNENDEMISSKEKTIADLFENINNKEKELLQANQGLALKDEEIAKMAGVFQEQTEICNGKVTSLQQQLVDSDLTIDSFKLKLSEGEGVLKDTTEKLMLRDAEIESLKKELQAKEADFDALHMKLQELINSNKELHDNIANLKKELSECKTKMNDTDTKLTEALDTLSVRDTEIETLKKELHSKETDYNTVHVKLEELTDCNKELNDNIASLKQEVSDCKTMMNDKDTQSTEALNTLCVRDAEIELLKKELHSKQIDYEVLHLKLEELNVSNKELNDNITSLKQELSEWKTMMNDKDTKLTEALDTLGVRDTEIETLKKELHSKETDYNTVHVKLEELKNDSNNGLLENIASLKQELSDCKTMMNDKDTNLTEALNTLVEKEKLISQLEPEKSYFKDQLVQHEIVTSELQDKMVILESELNQQKTYHHEVVDSLNAKHSVLSAQLGILKLNHEKREMEYSLIEKERHESLSKITELEAELENLFKDMEESNLEKQSLREDNEQLLSVKENLLLSLDDLKQNIEQKDIEIAEILSRLAQEQESCNQLMKCNKDLEKSYCLLQSSFSNLLQKSEENQSMLIQQEIKLQEHESTIESLQSKRIHQETCVQETNPGCSKVMSPSDIDEPDSKRDILVDIPETKENLKLSYQILMNQFLVLSEDSQQKDDLLIGQKLELEHNNSALQELSVKLEETNTTLSESLHSTASLRTEVDALKAQCHTLIDNEHTMKQKISSLEAQIESQEIISSHHVTECNRLAEQVAQMTQDLETTEKLLDKSKQESVSYLKEINDLKAELEIKSVMKNSLKEMVDSLTSSFNKSEEERELLKANFDSCMEDMQQKLTQQELEAQRLRSKLAEQTKTVCQGQDQMKDIFELQICQLEEKLLQSEKQSEQLAKDLADSKTKYTTCKDLYEGQLSDLEISLQSANSEVAKLRDQLSKIRNNHECEVAGLKRLHEIQTNELEDSCLALERNVSELRRQINEQTLKFNKERNNLEQSIEFQLSDNEEKRRVYEAEISRLKRHLEEMQQDHEMEMRNLEKSCEARMYELEDKCCIATNELERLRKSFSTDGDYSEERHRMDLRIDELETKRRDLEIHNRDLEEEVHHLREQLVMREDELKSLLHSMAEKVEEKGTETAEEIISLRHQLTEMFHEKDQALDSLQSMKTDLEKSLARNKDLQLRITELEKLVEQLVRVRRDEDGKEKSGLENLQSQINSLSEENNSLKRQLSVKVVSRQSLSLKPGVEAICPPYSHVSTHYSSSTVDECFSPVVEPEVLEGFVAENSNQAKRGSRPNANNNSMNNQEPDFVEEQNDRFQPEMEQEREMDSTNQLNMHPIWENEIHEGFEPETSDLFLIEPAEEPSQGIVWPRELSVGMSPSHPKPAELQFDFNLGGELAPQAHKAEGEASGTNEAVVVNDMTSSNGMTSSNDNDTNFSNDTMPSTKTEVEENVREKQMNELKEHLEEQYVLKMRTQEATLMCQYEAQVEKYKKEIEQHFAQKVQAVRYEWERKFTKALRQLKRDMERKTKEQELRANSSDRTDSSPGSRLNDRPDIAERNMELGEQVEKLHKENQELAEVRDDLLRQIEISQARGLHDRVQHELQTMLTTRDMHPSSPTSLTPTPMSPTGDYEESPTLVDQSVEEEADGSRSEVSESSSIRECFLEELEQISHQSGQDLPLEWELTSTETGVFEQEPASIWEVFDGRCARQDCQEVRIRFHKLYQWVVKNQGVGYDEAMYELNCLLGNTLVNSEALKNESIVPSLSDSTSQTHSIADEFSVGSDKDKIGSSLNDEIEIKNPKVNKSIFDEILEIKALEDSGSKESESSTSQTSKKEFDVMEGKDHLGKNKPNSLTSGSSTKDSGSELYNLSIPEESNNNSLLTLQDQNLAEELNLLRKDLFDTKALYCQENALLQKALLKDQLEKEMVMSKLSNDLNPEVNIDHSTQETTTCNSSSEELITEEKLSICMEQINILEVENASLRSRLRKQEAMTVHLKFQLHQKDQEAVEWQKTFSNHLTALQKQRSDLVQLLGDKESGKEPFISAGVQEIQRSNSIMKVQEDLLGKIEELDHLYKMLTLRQVELQHCEAERRHLEQMCLLKDFTEIQLMKQKRMMEEHISEIELRLHDREAALRDDKNRLLQELKEQDVKLTETVVPSSAVIPEDMAASKTNPSTGSKVKYDDSEANRQHIKAIEVLRAKLLKEYEMQAAKSEKLNKVKSTQS